LGDDQSSGPSTTGTYRPSIISRDFSFPAKKVTPCALRYLFQWSSQALLVGPFNVMSATCSLVGFIARSCKLVFICVRASESVADIAAKARGAWSMKWSAASEYRFLGSLPAT